MLTLVDDIYDTLMGNTNYPQLNLDEVENQELFVDTKRNGSITFDYQGYKVQIDINATLLEVQNERM